MKATTGFSSFRAARGLLRPVLLSLLTICLVAGPALAQEGEEDDGERRQPKLRFGFEAKTHFRDSDSISFRREIPTPIGVVVGNLATVDPGEHVEISTLTLFLDAEWHESLVAHAKIDFIDLYDRNPTSTDKEVDVDEIWLRFGRETDPAVLPDRPSAYVKVGKMPRFERQDDRHLESYGLISTAFNRFEDTGLELGVDLGTYAYLKASLTQGNPVFMRDPNALAGDNGTPESTVIDGDPPLGSGIVIPYDAEVEDLDLDGDLETAYALGLRFADASGNLAVDFLAFRNERKLAQTQRLNGTIYGGDLDLLAGPFNDIPFPVTSDDKEETGANLWFYWGGFSAFVQAVEQDLGGLERKGFEVELAWSFDLPLRWGLGGRQLFPYIQPAIRYSELDPQFGVVAGTPTPSFAWDWEKLDVGLRVGIIPEVDLTIEHATNDFVVAGTTRSNDEFLVTLRARMK